MNAATAPTKLMIVSLYRRILKKSITQLVHTDREFFRQRVKQEFLLLNSADHKFTAKTRTKMYQKGLEFEQNLGGIM
jgi:hypothetical protein